MQAVTGGCPSFCIYAPLFSATTLGLTNHVHCDATRRFAYLKCAVKVEADQLGQPAAQVSPPHLDAVLPSLALGRLC